MLFDLIKRKSSRTFSMETASWLSFRPGMESLFAIIFLPV